MRGTELSKGKASVFSVIRSEQLPSPRTLCHPPRVRHPAAMIRFRIAMTATHESHISVTKPQSDHAIRAALRVCMLPPSSRCEHSEHSPGRRRRNRAPILHWQHALPSSDYRTVSVRIAGVRSSSGSIKKEASFSARAWPSLAGFIAFAPEWLRCGAAHAAHAIPGPKSALRLRPRRAVFSAQVTAILNPIAGRQGIYTLPLTRAQNQGERKLIRELSGWCDSPPFFRRPSARGPDRFADTHIRRALDSRCNED